jgi:hypothetical protein
VTAIINSRMILMGAAIQPWMAGEPRGRTALNLFFLTDANWLIATRYGQEGGRDLGVLLGSGWALGGLGGLHGAGHLLGALVADPRRYGLDLVMPIFFCAMLVPLWRGARARRPWAVAGAVALLVHALVPGYAFIGAGRWPERSRARSSTSPPDDRRGTDRGAAGSALAILLMGVATYLCRSSGVVLMSRVRITPRVERGLRALPGCIVVSTVLPDRRRRGFAAALGARRGAPRDDPAALRARRARGGPAGGMGRAGLGAVGVPSTSERIGRGSSPREPAGATVLGRTRRPSPRPNGSIAPSVQPLPLTGTRVLF